MASGRCNRRSHQATALSRSAAGRQALTGIGISQSDVGRLFKNFGQANRATASKFGGTGLGLVLSEKLCALMGGGISATSELGYGSCFTIRVLAWMNEQQRSEASDPAAAPAVAYARAV